MSRLMQGIRRAIARSCQLDAQLLSALRIPHHPCTAGGSCSCGGSCGGGGSCGSRKTCTVVVGDAGCGEGLWFPDDSMPERLSSYEGVEYEQAESNVDQYRVLNNNPVPVPAAPNSVQLALQYNRRKELSCVNVSTDIVYIGFGFIPTATSYTYALAGCGSANDGTGGTLINDSWKGPVFAASATGAGVVNYTDIPEDSVTVTRKG